MENFLFSDCAYHDGKMYMFSSQNGFFTKLDLESNVATFMPTFVDELYDKGDCIDLIQVHQDKVYALKNAGDALIEYNLKDDSYKCYNPECAENPWWNYIYMTEYNSKLYIFTRYRNVVKVFDCVNKKFSTIEYDVENQTFYSGERVNDVVWLFPRNGNIIVAFDLSSRKTVEYVVDIKLEDAVNCYADNYDIYILTVKGDILVWNIEKTELRLFRKAKQSEQMGRIVVAKAQIVLLPSLGDKIVIIDKDTCDEKIYEGYPEDFQYIAPSDWSKYNGYCKSKSKIHFAMRTANYILTIDELTGEILWKKPLLPTDAEKIEYLLKNDKNIIIEQSGLLEGLIEYLSKDSEN